MSRGKKTRQPQPKTTLEMTQIAPNTWAVKSGGADTKVVNFLKHPPVPTFGGNEGKEWRITYGDSQSSEIWRWGLNNLLPQERENLIMENNLVHELIATKIAVVSGARRYFYTEEFSEGEMKKVEVYTPQWWKDLEDSTYKMTRRNFDEHFDNIFKNLFMHANSPVEMVRNKGGKITAIEPWDCVNARALKQDKRGYIPGWLWCGDWKRYKSKREDFPVMYTPAYNYDEENRQAKFVLHLRDGLLHDGYYGIPGWWGSRKWVATSNKIPMFHESNIDNGYFIKLHVEMPADYFDDKATGNRGKTETEMKEYEDRVSTARRKFMEKVNKLFTGADGNKILYTEYEMNKQLGKDYPGIKIHVLETNKLDESMLKLQDSAVDAVISAQGIFPSLASIQTQGKLSSGSELRNALNVYTAIKAPRFRRMAGEVYELCRRINAPTDKVKMGWKDIEVTNLDENPMGTQAISNE